MPDAHETSGLKVDVKKVLDSLDLSIPLTMSCPEKS